ncbi:MAG: transposase [Opitutaceae bacterium]|jgi:putative transposase|nr:transposase [Opitutaceae bacterium]
MARKLRISYPGALYHVINRGNYRSNIFATEGAKRAFLKCLWQAAEKANWRIHAFVIMRNHYHLALDTPDGNLVEGMRWLQSTYANRFNRLRKESGHVFQGRYNAILVENEQRLGMVSHYIHLNPVRAKIVKADRPESYPWSSLIWLNLKKDRPTNLTLSSALAAAGDLKDGPVGKRKYLEYLEWLATDDDAQKEMLFARMSKGWINGTREFAKSVSEDHQVLASDPSLGRESHELKELGWETTLTALLKKLVKSSEDISTGRKSADWKVAVAATMRTRTTATNRWLAEKLNMGAPDGVSRYVSEAKNGSRSTASKIMRQL